MANWNREKVDPININGGKQFTEDDDLAINELNTMVNNSFYGVDFVEGMTESPIVVNNDPSVQPSVEFVDYTKVIDGKERTFKKFKLSNFKGKKGDKGDKGDKGETGIGFNTITNETLNTKVVNYNTDAGATIQMTKNIQFNDGTSKNINSELNLNIKGQNGINIDANETNDGLIISSDNVKVEVDSTLSTTSKNPVQNKVITAELDKFVRKDASEFQTLQIGGHWKILVNSNYELEFTYVN